MLFYHSDFRHPLRHALRSRVSRLRNRRLGVRILWGVLFSSQSPKDCAHLYWAPRHTTLPVPHATQYRGNRRWPDGSMVCNTLISRWRSRQRLWPFRQSLRKQRSGCCTPLQGSDRGGSPRCSRHPAAKGFSDFLYALAKING